MKCGTRGRLVFEPLEPRRVLNVGPLLITEFLADNDSVLADQDGDYSDWIEIHNPTDAQISLDGWHLTDDAAMPSLWTFPDVSLESGGYTTVFASGKNLRDPSATLHTNFQLNDGGEYLALVQPDGTIAHEFADEYPDQSSDTSYGMWLEIDSMVAEGAEVSYHVPTAADAAVGTDWTGVDFDNSDWVGAAPPTPIMITEISGEKPDWLEIQNVSQEEFNTAGWVVVTNWAASRDINAYGSPVNPSDDGIWEMPESVLPGEILYVTDDYSDDYAGNNRHDYDGNFYWRTTGGGWVLIMDPTGQVADFMIWGYTPEEMALFDIKVNDYPISMASMWDGPAIADHDLGLGTLQRQGNEDTNQAGDFAFVTTGGTTGSRGVQNTGLVVPFAGMAGAPRTTGIGFDIDGSEFDGAVRTDIQSEMHGVNSTVWARVPFTIADVAAVDTMLLRMTYDDGFVAYLNGQEIARQNAPAETPWNAAADDELPSGQSPAIETFPIDNAAALLRLGKNVLAIHGLNAGAADEEFLLVPELFTTATIDAQRYFLDPTPGGPNTTALAVINEIHSDPDVKTELVEFIEIFNAGGETLDMSNWYLSGGIDYRFPEGTLLVPGDYLVVSENPGQMEEHLGVLSLGPYLGKLDNDGDRIVLHDATGLVRDRVEYKLGFPWPTVGDAHFDTSGREIAGSGSSMELIHPTMDNDLGGSWRSSEAAEYTTGTRPPTPGRANSVLADNAAPHMRQVSHSPQSPTTGDDVTITVKVTDPHGVDGVTLLYQLVNPGTYIEIGDPRYATNWTAMPMHDDGLDGDAVADDDIYTVIIPGNRQYHRRLIRYRITVEDTLGASITGPYADDPTPNFAYYVYDGVPSWTGAARPGVTPNVEYDSELLNTLPIYQLITTEKDHVDAMHIPDSTTGGDNSNLYRYQGTLVYNGEVYDHIRYRPRGGVWRFSMGKNMWKFDFNRGRYFQAHDDYGRPYEVKWDKMNFSALIQQGNFDHRGEQGLFEGVGFKLFNLAGVPASNTNFVHFRIVESGGERGATQYDSDFQGLYMTLEQPDGRLLEQHDQPDGNFYKIEGYNAQIPPNNQGPTQPDNGSDFTAFNVFRNTTPSEQWWRDNFELDEYYSYRSIVESIHHYDIAYGKNYFYYHNPENDKWAIRPWDLDLTWANNMYGNGNHQFVSKVANRPPFNTEYRNRMREIRDLLYNSDQTGMLIDEIASFIYTPGERSFVDADRAMWDYNPILTSSYVNSSKAGHGRFYGATPTRDFAGMIQLVKNYVNSRGAWIDSTILNDDRYVPRKPTITYTGAAGHPLDELTFRSSNFSSSYGSFGAMKWRIAEVTDTDSPDFNPDVPRVYEINANWESDDITTFNNSIALPGLGLEEGKTYRARVRMADSTGRWSHWSNPVEFVAGAPVVTPADGLRITEIMYHPTDPTAEELAIDATFSTSDFEFVELQNISDVAISLAGVQFTDGIAFDFTATDVTSLDPGETVVVVRNLAAYEARYGSGSNVAGEFLDSKFDDGGETVELQDGYSTVIHAFTYDDGGRWPGRADGKGSSLEVVDTEGDYADANNWRSSSEYNGTPDAIGSGPRRDVVINEVLSHTDLPWTDSIELYNTTGSAIELGGWYLSDSSGNYLKYRIPDGTSILGGGYLVFDETHFGGVDGFALNGAHGDDVWLVETNAAGEPVSFVDHVEFGDARNGESFGRWPDSDGPLYPMTGRSFGQPNPGPRIGPLLISEIQYNAQGILEPGVVDELEFVEIVNPTGAAIDLTNWRIRGGVDFDFAPGTLLASGATLVVVPFGLTETAKLDAFRDHYDIDASVAIAGPFEGTLDNGGETVRLQRPDEPPLLEPDYIPHLLEDEAVYEDDAPWPVGPDGNGESLQRTGPGTWGHDVASWLAATPTPGFADIQTADDAYEPNDSLAEAYDLAAAGGSWLSTIAGEGLQANDDWYEITGTPDQRRVTVDLTYTHALGNVGLNVVNASGIVLATVDTNADGELFDDVLPTGGSWYLHVFGDATGNAYDLSWNHQYAHPGDADLSGSTDLSDFNIWNANKFVAGTTWRQGDFNGDGNTDLSDFNIWNAYKFTQAPAPAPINDAVLAETADEIILGQESLLGDLAWLDELERTQSDARSTGQNSPTDDAVDRLLASYWP